METRDYDTPPPEPAEFANDLATLRPQALRDKYPKEASSHQNIKSKAKRRGWAFDPAWNNFRDFLRDMGPLPSREHSVERRDRSLESYGPGIVYWADKLTQTQNRSNTRRVKFRGAEPTLAEFAVLVGKPYPTVHSALARGKTPEQIAGPVSPSAAAGWQHPYPPEEVEFREAYADWRGRVQRDFHQFRHPEVYYLLQCYRRYWRSRNSFDNLDLSPEEEVAHVGYQRHRRAFEGIDLTLSFIRQARPELAHKLTSKHGNLEYFATLMDRVIISPPR